jgi:hypothetical protein
LKIHSASMLGRHALWQRSWARMAKQATAGVAPHWSFSAITGECEMMAMMLAANSNRTG